METKNRARTRIGFSRMEKQYEWKDHMIFMGLLLAFAVWVNRGIEIKGLYMDDLYFWSCYGEQGFLQYVFPVGSTRFRFLYYLAAWLEMAVVGNHVSWFVPVNILLNAGLSWTIYWMGRRLAGSKGIGFLCGFMFLSSRMAYYQIGQVLGLMETMALWMALGILWNLYRYLNEEDPVKRRGCFYRGCGLYFGVSFVHERYMVLFPLLLLVLLVRKRKGVLEWAVGVGSFLLIQGIRALTIGSVLPAGTGGTQVADTFHIKDALGYALSQIAYVFGMNAGPEHLNGLPWKESPVFIKLLILLADGFVMVLVAGFVWKLVREKDKVHRAQALWNSLLFLLFTGLCIASSSVTIRVEMRWVYVSLTSALLFLAYLYGELTRGVKEELYLKRLWPWGVAFAAYVLLMLPVELFYRGYYPKLYLWPQQTRYNSLAEETYGRYGDQLFGKTIYILGNKYEMSDFTAGTFFKVFDKERRAEGTRVVFIDSIREIGLVEDSMLVLREDPDQEGFQDVTDFVKKLKLQVEYGYYDDGWMDQHAAMTVMAGKEGLLNLEIIFPGVMEGGESVELRVDGGKPRSIPIGSSQVETTVQAEPWQMVDLEFACNFYMKDAQEQRGEEPLAVIVHMNTP